MRKLFASTLAFATFPIFVQPALSLPVHQIGSHDAGEIASFCGAVGGSFGIYDSPGGGIIYRCSWGGSEGSEQQRSVHCKDNGVAGDKVLCVSDYDPKDPRAPKLPPPKKGKREAPTTSANTTNGFSNTRNVGGAPGRVTTASGSALRGGVTAATKPTTNPAVGPSNSILGGGAFGSSQFPNSRATSR